MIDLARLRVHVRNRHTGLDLANNLAHRGDQAKGIAMCAQLKRHPIDTLTERNVDNRRDGQFEGVVPGCLGYTNDFKLVELSVTSAEAEVAASRILIRKILLCENFIDYCNFGRPRDIAFLKLPAQQNRNAHRRKERRADYEDGGS